MFSYHLGMKILVAEDELEIAESYKLILERRSHEVVLTADGLQCTEVYRVGFSASRRQQEGTPFDLVMLDFKMPKKDGLEAAKDILSMCPGQRIVIASATPPDKIMQAMNSYKIDLIQKPFSLRDLVNMVESGNKHAENQSGRGYFTVARNGPHGGKYS